MYASTVQTVQTNSNTVFGTAKEYITRLVKSDIASKYGAISSLFMNSNNINNFLTELIWRKS